MASDDRWTASACENVLADIPDAMQRMTERQFRALLLTALDALRAAPRWVPVEERLPEEGWVGLAAWPRGEWRTIEWSDGRAHACCYDERNDGEPVAWLDGVPLPPLPEEDERRGMARATKTPPPGGGRTREGSESTNEPGGATDLPPRPSAPPTQAGGRGLRGAHEGIGDRVPQTT